jgi:hypothetical protein
VRRRLRYVLTALTLGLAWYAVLLVPPSIRGFLGGLGHPTSAALVCATSLVVALTLRRPIADSDYDLRLAVFAPYYGALVFGCAAAVTIWVQNGFRALNYFDLFVLVPYWTLLAALWSFYLVIPMGFLAQRVMRRAAESR